MSPFWSTWIMVLIVFNLGITLFLFVWGTRVDIPTLPDGTSGHVWAHGTVREAVRKLPLWWVLMSVAMFVVAFGYLTLFPGFGGFKGLLDWSSEQQLAQNTATNNVKLDAAMQRFGNRSIEQLANEPAAVQIGRRLFIDNCAACHGPLGHGNREIGAPNLTDAAWLYGGGGDAVMASILDGRNGVMPPFGAAFDAATVSNLAHYVLSLSGDTHSQTAAAAAKPMFAVCSACHGADGTGNPALGAPDLTDAAWLYGSDLDSIEDTIRNGRSGAMPAWRARIGEPQVRLVAAWIYAQSHTDASAAP